ncbi:MAG: rRNA maturation RNase YbeY [Spirochaetaceae bacterium]|jgi:probable rRNA maturation factor|nr:rRNA maturation RNase YbeY [Spirochaetaceae bacterium]
MNRVEVQAEGLPLPLWSGRLEAFALRVLEKLAVKNWDLSVLLCDEKTIEELNARYRGRSEPTDVLSFELGETFNSDGEQRFLPGDIVISLPELSKNAVYFNVSEDEELRRLVVHGILHLDGMDHSGNSAEEPMLFLQETILSELDGERVLS